MEELVNQTQSLLWYQNNSAKIFILGHEGYIGSNLYKWITGFTNNVVELDSRHDNLDRLEILSQDFVIDCSRLNCFSKEAQERDFDTFGQLITWVHGSGASYLRIASTLEFSENPEGKYVAWSSKRTSVISSLEKTGTLDSVFVPNLYGGERSTSVIDLLIENYSRRKFLELDHPEARRDFLHIDSVFPTIIKWLTKPKLQQRIPDLLTSGTNYQIGSLRDYLYLKSDDFLQFEKAAYPKSLKIEELPDNLLGHLQSHWTS
jgi:nucleoside-diphosphate-sugar epimerase